MHELLEERLGELLGFKQCRHFTGLQLRVFNHHSARSVRLLGRAQELRLFLLFLNRKDSGRIGIIWLGLLMQTALDSTTGTSIDLFHLSFLASHLGTATLLNIIVHVIKH